MKKLATTLAAAGVMLAAAPAFSQEVSFNIGAVSLYKSKGVDQEGRDTNWRPAIQGGFDVDFGNGFYVGNWNSTGNFIGSFDDKANLEIDLYGGYAGQITENLGFDVGYVHFYYPGAKSFGNSGEVYGSLSYGPVSFMVARGVTTDVNKGDLYYKVSYELPLTDALTFSTSVGYYDYDAAGDRSKTDYSLGLGYDMGDDWTVTAALQGANRKNDVTDGSRDNRLVLGFSKSF